MDTVPVVLAADSNYLPFAYVTMYSILENRKKPYAVMFYLLVPQNMKAVDYDAAWEFQDYEIEYIEISDSYFSGAPLPIAHITTPMYYRLLIPELFPALEKCIYLDVDILVCDDIYKLYQTEVTNVYLAAGLGTDICFTEEAQKALADFLHLPSAKYYFNSGVLVMNLENMRVEKLSDTFLEYSKKEWRCPDQDILNICCYGKTRILPWKYNIYSLGYGYERAWLKSRFSGEEIDEGLREPCVIHYATGRSKPWRSLKAVKVEEWWLAAKRALPERVYRDLYRAAEEQTEKTEIPEIILKMELYENVIIFGCGKSGKSFYSMLNQLGLGKVSQFWDNHVGEEGKMYGNVPVCLPKPRERDDTLVVICCQRGAEEIKAQLLELGFCDRGIAVYQAGDFDAWFVLDEKYRQEARERFMTQG